ncbi:MAG: aminodeoxychorismate synthase component I [Candidatus Omnitrophica bacterium]|nr:aminodeoxychorismate synthase component I [Candidatus Omnitrophota bacterium]MCM8802250.1 aminodeoxychorismate synthase component I [Candidatus Omnitrophota bacterium]
MANLFLEKLQYLQPENLLPIIHNLPFSFLINVNWSKKENYTIFGFEPFMIFKSKKEKIEIREKNEVKKFQDRPIEQLQKIFDKFILPSHNFFLPGGFGYLSYDFGWQIEKLPNLAIDDLKLPDIFICFYDAIFLFDNRERKTFLISYNFENDKFFARRFNEIKRFYNQLASKSLSFKIENHNFSVESLSSNMSYSYYISAIKKIRDYIREGDVYQINFSHRFEIKGVFEPYNLFLKLQKVNPAPYSAYFNFDGFILVSNSPELFIKKEGRKIITKPMKGTRKTGENSDLNRKIIEDLLESEKDRAELIMIVDLERNDLGKICEYGSVKVKKLINLEKYKTVYQTTSTIEGILKKEIELKDIIKATFPGGSITGAPKKRAMEIIEELEPTKRNFYTGCLGYFGFNENLQLNILIRTLLIKNNKIYYPVGGGIVWDSIPEKEYEETIVKAKNLFLTIGIEENEIRNIIV